MHIFDNDNFSIIPKSIFFDNDNLPISCKNANISAVDNFFDNIAHPYVVVIFLRLEENTLLLNKVVCAVILFLGHY